MAPAPLGFALLPGRGGAAAGMGMGQTRGSAQPRATGRSAGAPAASSTLSVAAVTVSIWTDPHQDRQGGGGEQRGVGIVAHVQVACNCCDRQDAQRRVAHGEQQRMGVVDPRVDVYQHRHRALRRHRPALPAKKEGPL